METQSLSETNSKYRELNLKMNSDGADESMKEFSKICESVGYKPADGTEEGAPVEPLPVPKSLDELVKGLHVIFAEDNVNVELVKAYMAMYKSNYKEWKKFAIFDQYRYTRNLVDVGNGKFNLMVLCWNESQGSSIHSHADAHCFMKVLDGTVSEQMFEWPNESDGETGMQSVGINKYGKNQVAYINDDLGLHRVENPSHSDKAVSLHLYSPPFDSCDMFDEKTGHKNSCNVTFWSKFGKRTPFGKTGTAKEETHENN